MERFDAAEFSFTQLGVFNEGMSQMSQLGDFARGMSQPLDDDEVLTQLLLSIPNEEKEKTVSAEEVAFEEDFLHLFESEDDRIDLCAEMPQEFVDNLRLRLR